MKVDFSKRIAVTFLLAAQNSVHVVLADRLGKSSSSTVVTANKIETARLLQKFDARKLDVGADITTVVQGAIDEFAGEKPDPAHHHSYVLYKKKCLAVLHLLDSHYPGYGILTKYGWLCGADKEVTSAPTDALSPSKAPSFAPTKRACNTTSDCCESEDGCVTECFITTTFCWDFALGLPPVEGQVDCSSANECTYDADCIEGDFPLCVSIPFSYCFTPPSTNASGVCDSSPPRPWP